MKVVARTVVASVRHDSASGGNKRHPLIVPRPLTGVDEVAGGDGTDGVPVIPNDALLILQAILHDDDSLVADVYVRKVVEGSSDVRTIVHMCRRHGVKTQPGFW